MLHKTPPPKTACITYSSAIQIIIIICTKNIKDLIPNNCKNINKHDTRATLHDVEIERLNSSWTMFY